MTDGSQTQLETSSNTLPYETIYGSFIIGECFFFLPFSSQGIKLSQPFGRFPSKRQTEEA